jgi:hypothetical protein
VYVVLSLSNSMEDDDSFVARVQKTLDIALSQARLSWTGTSVLKRVLLYLRPKPNLAKTLGFGSSDGIIAPECTRIALADQDRNGNTGTWRNQGDKKEHDSTGLCIVNLASFFIRV